MNSSKDANQSKGEFRIDELLGGIYETETMNIEDGSELLQEGLAEDEKARILQITMRKMGADSLQSTHRKPLRGKKRRILIASLVAVCAFATTAFAAEVFQWDSRLSNYFGIGEHNSAELSEGSMNVGVKAENNGVTIEAIQTIGDANNMYILLDVTAPEGEILYPYSSFEMIYLSVDGVTSMGYSCDMLPDDNENDNKATFLFAMEANKKINDKTINIKFNDLRHYIIGSGEMISDCKGQWELEWKLNYEDISTTYSIGNELAVNGETVTVDSISISPIAVNVQLSGSYIQEYDSHPPEPGAGDLFEITAITLKDGTVLTQEDAFSWGASTRGKEYVMNMQMKDLLDVSQVKSVTLNGTEIVLK